jgi:hypothetical protein
LGALDGQRQSIDRRDAQSAFADARGEKIITRQNRAALKDKEQPARSFAFRTAF